MNATEINRGMAKIKEAVANIEQTMAITGDRIHAEKMRQLAEKADDTVLNIAFCGHFSAGKSSLINKLCGQALLPSSPIPTSANIVEIRDGNPGVTVRHYAREAQPPVLAEIGIGELDAYCRNGADIESIHIRYPVPLLGGRAALLDTPGIDSTDDAHMKSTESALHMADVVFYVMDYNHVQSEINFGFTKRLKEWGKPLYLVVNMIDKHKEREIPFEEYRRSVYESFANWHIVPDGILFMSVKRPDHPHAEWEKLVWLIEKLSESSEPLRELSLVQSARFMVEEHGRWLAEQNEAEKAEYREQMKREGGDEAAERYEEARRELEQCRMHAETLRQHLRAEIASLLENANITPAATRDLADHYLQSRKPGFKVGFFGRAAATAKEIERRLEAFREHYAEQVEANIVWHLRSLLIREGERHGIGADAVDSELAGVQKGITAQWLAEQVQPGASFTGEYTLNYSRHISAETKSMFRRAGYQLADLIADQAGKEMESAAEGLKRELEELESKLAARHALAAIEERERQYLNGLRAASDFPVPDPSSLLPDMSRFVAPVRDEEASAELAAEKRFAIGMPEVKVPLAQTAIPQNDSGGIGGPADNRYRESMETAAGRLEEACALLAPIQSMKSVVRTMREKAERLKNSRFTIALFGAFSAGKSSFANALMGEAVLPVSPNPTTAAINKVMPPTEDWPHGSVKVQMKTARAVWDDVLFSLNALGAEAADMEAALAQIRKLKPEHVSPSGKPHFTFLKAVLKGWDEAKGHLGAELRVDLALFRSYVADESKSCFVDFIELYYKCPLTEQGMVLVDTPGADSINARHTGVAFQYIKNADAILFVTYYNHAFSQADREFLLQLGRVKDSFELDKMFFLVNAADLASSREELDGVVGHVAGNLLQFGIRNPRIYPVSSLLALEGKSGNNAALAENSGILAFERDFIQFAVGDLAGMAVRSASQELERSQALLSQWIGSAREGEQERLARANALREAWSKANEWLSELDTAAEEKETAKEVQELLYYVKQRLTYRFGELFQYAFNPASLREDHGSIRSSMRAAWHELLRLISYDLSQELYATTLRVENALNRLVQKRLDTKQGQIVQSLAGFVPAPYENAEFPTPEVEESLEAEADDKWLAGYYKNGKHFFEGPGKSQLKDAVEKALAAPIAEYTERHGARFVEHYTALLKERVKESQERVRRLVDEHAEGLLAALSQNIDLGELEAVHDKLARLIER